MCSVAYPVSSICNAHGISNIYGHHLALGATEEIRKAKGPALTQASNIGATRVFDQVAPHFDSRHVLQYGEEETVRVAPLDAMVFKRVAWGQDKTYLKSIAQVGMQNIVLCKAEQLLKTTFFLQ